MGDVLAGKYRVERILGTGSMGVVVAARHQRLGTRVAIKLLLPHLLKNAEVVARFEREARAVAGLRSEHVPRVLDMGSLPSGASYIVMEYLEGRDLEDRIAKDGPLRFDRAAELVLQACDALGEAHALGIIHRDVKPANLFVVERPDGTPCVKVLDFGISKIRRTSPLGSDQSFTHTSAMMGSPLYMSPEQIDSAKNVDERSDIWALGVVLYELVSGSLPFVANSMPELIERMFTTEPAPLAPDASVPPEFEAIVRRCLRREPSLRYASVGELTAALRPFAAQSKRAPTQRRLAPASPPTAPAEPKREPATALAETRLASVPPRVPSSSLRRRPKLLLVVAASALVLGALLRLAWR